MIDVFTNLTQFARSVLTSLSDLSSSFLDFLSSTLNVSFFFGRDLTVFELILSSALLTYIGVVIVKAILKLVT